MNLSTLSIRANSLLKSSDVFQRGNATIKLQETIHLDEIEIVENARCSDIIKAKIFKWISNEEEASGDSSRMQRALVDFFLKNFQFEFRRNNLVVALCESVLITGISCCICNPQEKLLAFSPLDPNIENAIAMSGATVHRVELFSKDGFAASVAMLEEAFKEANQSGVVRGVVFCNPVNPTGKMYSAEEIRSVVQWCIKHSLHIIINDLFMLTARESFLRHSGSLLNSPLVHWIYDLGKDFGVSGVRCGLLYSSNERLLQAVHALLQPFRLSALDQRLVTHICEDQDWIQSTFAPESQRLLAANLVTVRAQLSEIGVEVMGAVGCPFVWADFRKVLGSHTESAETRLRQMMSTCGVDLCSSQQFGGKECGWFRIAIGHPMEILIVAMQRIHQAVEAFVQQREEMSDNDANLLLAAGSDSASASSSLDSLMHQLYKQIKTSTWLQENSADKWEEENPDLAFDYRARIDKHN